MIQIESLIDILRASHLICFAAGMGTALFFDFQSFLSLNNPMNARDIANLERIHIWIVAAFSGLWLTGIALVYVRTGFDLALFSPKLWLKIGIMLLMTVNARLISTRILPMMRAYVNRPVGTLPKVQFAFATQVAVVSLFCWSSGVFLGSSVVLKTAPWDILIPLALSWFLFLAICGHVTMMLRRSTTKPTRRTLRSHPLPLMGRTTMSSSLQKISR